MIKYLQNYFVFKNEYKGFLLDIFKPDFLIRSSFIQTLFAAKGMKNWKAKNSSYFLLNLPGGVKLSGYKDLPENKPIAHLILLHGWEGSLNSSYIKKTSKYFLENNYCVIRLNMRDHGDSHSFNLEPFHGCRLEEIYLAIKEIASKINTPVFLAGFSLGGNYTARIIIEVSKRREIKNLKAGFCVSPSINPKDATQKIEDNIFYRKYFLNSWKKSLNLKHKFFPHIYKKEDWNFETSVMDLTENLVIKYGGFNSLYEYFNGYTIKNEDFLKLNRNLYILISKDDPIIPYKDFTALNKSKFLSISVTDYGGHNGFLKNMSDPPYYTNWMKEKISKMIIPN